MIVSKIDTTDELGDSHVIGSSTILENGMVIINYFVFIDTK